MTPQMMPVAPVGSALREARLAAGMTIEQLAVRAGVGGATVERIEHDRVTPHQATLFALAQALPGPVNEKRPTGEPGASQSNADVGSGDVAKTAGGAAGNAGP